MVIENIGFCIEYLHLFYALMFSLCSNKWRSRSFHKESAADLTGVVIKIQQQIKQDYKKVLLKIAEFSYRCFICCLRLHWTIVKADCNCSGWLFGVSPYWANVSRVFILLFHSFNFQRPSQFRQTYHIFCKIVNTCTLRRKSWRLTEPHPLLQMTAGAKLPSPITTFQLAYHKS